MAKRKQKPTPTTVESKHYCYKGRSYPSIRDIPNWPLSKKESMLESGEITIETSKK